MMAKHFHRHHPTHMYIIANSLTGLAFFRPSSLRMSAVRYG